MNESVQGQDGAEYVKIGKDPSEVIFLALNRMAASIGNTGEYRATIEKAMAVYILIAPRLKKKQQNTIQMYLALALSKTDLVASLNLCLKVVEAADSAGLYFKTVQWAAPEGSAWDGVTAEEAEGKDTTAGDTNLDTVINAVMDGPLDVKEVVVLPGGTVKEARAMAQGAIKTVETAKAIMDPDNPLSIGDVVDLNDLDAEEGG